MSDSTIEHLSEQLRAQGLTWGQTNFVVSLLRAELSASREREARLAAKLAYALRQNDLDMLLTGDEIRDCRAALAEGAQG